MIWNLDPVGEYGMACRTLPVVHCFVSEGQDLRNMEKLKKLNTRKERVLPAVEVD